MYWQALSPEGLAATLSILIDDILALVHDEDQGSVTYTIPDTTILLRRNIFPHDVDNFYVYGVSIDNHPHPVFDFTIYQDNHTGEYHTPVLSRYRDGLWVNFIKQHQTQVQEQINQEIAEFEGLIDDRIRTAFAPIDDKDLLTPKLTSELVKTESPKSINTLVQELNGDDLAEDCELEDYLNDGWEIIQIGVHSDALNRLIRTVTLQLS